MTNKTLKGIIQEYVDKKDLYGLAEFARAMVEDSITERDELKQKIQEALSNDHFCAGCSQCKGVKQIIENI